MIRGILFALLFVIAFALVAGVIAGGTSRDPDEAQALGFVLGRYGAPPVLVLGFLTGFLTRKKRTPPTPTWREPEDPNARWACPKCRKENPNTTFACPCGYRVV